MSNPTRHVVHYVRSESYRRSFLQRMRCTGTQQVLTTPGSRAFVPSTLNY